MFDRAEHVSHANSYWTDSVYRNDTARQVTSLGSGYLHAGRWVIENITYQAKIIESSEVPIFFSWVVFLKDSFI